MNAISRMLAPVLIASATILPAAAQTAAVPPALPDPATIEVPDVTPSQDPKVRKEGFKFYYFHNPSVSFAEAVVDLRECRAHLATGGPARVPGFIPWDETHRRETPGISSPYGLIGYFIAAEILMPKIERGLRSNKMRRCMGTRGYDRYAITEKAWDVLNDGEEERLVLMQARLASGPKPQDAAVTE
jgi:hypothetical protein